MPHTLDLRELQGAMALVVFDTLKFVKHEMLRKDLDAKHEILRRDLNAKHEILRKDLDAKHEILRRDLNAKHEMLRKDMHAMAERFDAKLDKLGLTLTIRLTFIMIGVMSAAVTLNKLF